MLMTEEFLGFLFFYFSLMTSAFIALGGGGGPHNRFTQDSEGKE